MDPPKRNTSRRPPGTARLCAGLFPFQSPLLRESRLISFNLRLLICLNLAGSLSTDEVPLRTYTAPAQGRGTTTIPPSIACPSSSSTTSQWWGRVKSPLAGCINSISLRKARRKVRALENPEPPVVQQRAAAARVDESPSSQAAAARLWAVAIKWF